MSVKSVLGKNLWVAYVAAVALAIPWQRINWIHEGVTPFHVINASLMCIVALPFLARMRVRFYFIGPLFVYSLGSVLGMFASDFFAYNAYTIGQDIYLYMWFILISVVLADQRNAKYLVLAWMLALVMVLATEGRTFLADVGTERLEFSFRNPNRAASYFILTLVLLAHPSVTWIAKLGLGVLCFKALLSTGSAGGLLAFAVGIGIFGSAWLYVRYANRMRLDIFMALGLCGILLFGSVVLSAGEFREAYSDITGMSGSRVDRSASVREKIWLAGWESFVENPLGIGPGSFWQQVPTELGGVAENVELHSDWLATIAERGIVGIVGLIAFVFAIGMKSMEMLALAARAKKVSAIWPAAIAGGVGSYVMISVTHEVLHHETFWLLLALMMGCIKSMRTESLVDSYVDPTLSRGFESSSAKLLRR